VRGYLVVDTAEGHSEVVTSLRRAARITGLRPRLIVAMMEEEGCAEARGFVIAEYAEAEQGRGRHAELIQP
jgi:hypothetical protein